MLIFKGWTEQSLSKVLKVVVLSFYPLDKNNSCMTFNIKYSLDKRHGVEMSKCIHRFVVTDLLNHRSSHIPSGLSCHKRTVPAGKEAVLLLVFVPGRRTQREYSCERAATCSHLWAASATSERPPSSVALYLYTRRARRDPTVCTSAQHFHNKAREMRAE